MIKQKYRIPKSCILWLVRSDQRWEKYQVSRDSASSVQQEREIIQTDNLTAIQLWGMVWSSIIIVEERFGHRVWQVFTLLLKIFHNVQ